MSEPSDNGAAPSNAFDRLKARRRKLAEDKTLDLPVQGYGGDLVVRYKLLDWDTLNEIETKALRSDNPRAELYGQMDTLIAACDMVLIKADGDKEPRPAHEADPSLGEPLRFDERLADKLGFEAKSAREVLVGVFDGNETAIPPIYQALSRWLSGARAQVDEEFIEG